MSQSNLTRTQQMFDGFVNRHIWGIVSKQTNKQVNRQRKRKLFLCVDVFVFVLFCFSSNLRTGFGFVLVFGFLQT